MPAKRTSAATAEVFVLVSKCNKPPMNLRTHLLHSNGYQELGMFDESILELEEIEGEDRWHPLVVVARYNTYRDGNWRRRWLE